MRARLFLIPVLLSSAACSSPEDVKDEIAAPGAQATGSESAQSKAAPVAFEDNTGEGVDERMFSYSWPAEVSAIPKLAAALAGERDKALAEQKAEYAEVMADPDMDCSPCRTRSSEVEWSVVADLPRWLSLSAAISGFSGGAHGSYGTSSLVWDREAGRQLAPVDFFRSQTALTNALSQRFCSELNRQREEKRGEPVDPADEYFGDCPGLEDVTVLLGSSNGRSFDRIGLIADPYVAGPWAEGVYEMTLPVDTAVLDAVRPEYAKAFTLDPRQ